MNENKVVAARVNQELFDWLEKKASSKNIKVSDLIRQALTVFREIDSIPEEMQFNNLLQVQGSKAAMLTYRLLHLFIDSQGADGKEMLLKAHQIAKGEFEKYKVDLIK